MADNSDDFESDCKYCGKPLTCIHIEQQDYYGCEHVRWKSCEECWDEQYSDKEYVQQKRKDKAKQENLRDLKTLPAEIAA